MKKNIIVITGGAGFVGSNLITLLLKKTKFKIISIDNYSSGFAKNHIKEKRVKYINGDAREIKKILRISSDHKANESLSKKINITKNQILWGIKNEMALSLEDILARRTRCLFLDVFETEKLIDDVLDIMADVLNKNQKWKTQEKLSFLSLTKKYKI